MKKNVKNYHNLPFEKEKWQLYKRLVGYDAYQICRIIEKILLYSTL